MKTEELSLKRSASSYKNCSERFRFTKRRKFDLQYAQLYAVRLMAMKGLLTNAAKAKWGDTVAITKLSDLKKNAECVVIGTLFRKMELQPGILKEISLEEGVLPLPPPEKCGTLSDDLILEDEQQRVVLSGCLPLVSAVTGTVLAARGHATEGGLFEVAEHCYSDLPIQTSPCIDQALLDGEDRFVAFVSDLGLGGSHADLLSLQMLSDLLTGRLGCETDQVRMAKICRLIIAGNALSAETQSKDTDKIAKYLTRNVQARSVEAVKQLDIFLTQLGCCLPVDVMPGESDPTNQFLPQQPLHKCMFQQAAACSAVHSTTNPYSAIIGGLRFLGTSGQNVNNIYQFSGHDDRLEILEYTLRCGHIAPTCPDTLSCFPYYEEDPFILDTCPDVYFSGSQPEFLEKRIKGNLGQSVLLLTVPSFAKTKTVVLVNLRDLSTEAISLITDLDLSEDMDASSDAEH